jgi:transposase
MHTSQVAAFLQTHLLGPHPIIRHFIERLNLHAILRSCVGSSREPVLEHGEALATLVHNILDSPAPLYRIAAWAEPIAPSAMGLTPEQKQALNDDRIARMLDALVSERGRDLWFRLALRIIKQFHIATSRLHHDTTTVTFCGAYRNSVAAPRITYGHNKDHRPDLKQLVFGLTVSSDGAVPIHHQVLSGNRSDDTVHRENLEELRQIVGRSDFIYVADGKLASSANLREIIRHGGRFVTVLSRSRAEDKRFRARLRQEGMRWKKLMETPNKRRRGDPPDVWYSCTAPERTVEGFRLIWVRSSGKAEHDEAFRLRRLDEARVELALLSKRLNRRWHRFGPQIRRAVRAILRRTEMEAFLQVQLNRRVQKDIRHLKHGRPAAGDPVQVVCRTIWGLKVRVDEKALRAECHVDGVFPLATNLEKESKKEILEIYKYQPYVEKRFSQLKTDLEVAPVYLKKPLRCAGLAHAYYVALAVASLIERRVRQGMVREGLESLPLLPEGRQTSTPTCPRILEAFRLVTWHEFRRGDEIVRFPIELTVLQKLLLKLLEVPRELYA